MAKFKKALLIIGSFALFSGAFSSYAFSVYKKTPLDKSCTISIGLPEPTGFYVNVYRVVNDSEQLVQSVPLVVNPDNDSELMVSNLALQKGDKFKATNNTDWFGSATSYSHNISVGCSTSSGLVSSYGDYYAVQNGTYDIYVKFNNSTYTSYVSTYVNLDDTRVIYVQDTWDDPTDPEIHFWGSNVIISDGDNYVAGQIMTTKYENHDMYKFVVPNLASSFNIHYQNKWSNNLDFDNSVNAYQVYWDGASESMKIQAHNWSNPL